MSINVHEVRHTKLVPWLVGCTQHPGIREPSALANDLSCPAGEQKQDPRRRGGEWAGVPRSAIAQSLPESDQSEQRIRAVGWFPRFPPALPQSTSYTVSPFKPRRLLGGLASETRPMATGRHAHALRAPETTGTNQTARPIRVAARADAAECAERATQLGDFWARAAVPAGPRFHMLGGFVGPWPQLPSVRKKQQGPFDRGVKTHGLG
jgi:hypothetical protein